MKPARSPARYDDILEAAEGKVAEIIHGRADRFLAVGVAACVRGLGDGSRLDRRISAPPRDAPPREGWWFVAEPELRCGNNVLVPDQAGWRRPNTADRPTAAAFTHSPDWVCEIVSPGTGKIDRTRKMRIY